jgi:arylformamidase
MKKLNTLIDISVPLDSALPTWPGSEGMKVERLSCFENGNDVNVSRLTCDVHTGTHIETSLHFLPDGESVNQISLDILIGDAYVAHLPDADIITPDDLEDLKIPHETERLLLKTGNSRLWEECGDTFRHDFAALNSDAAEWIVERDIKLFGVDYLSVALYRDQDSDNHITLLKGGVVILEGLNLSVVDPGVYELICLPIKLVGVEGAPARAVLRTGNRSY